MLVDAVFRNNQCEIVEYQNLVKSCVYRDDNNGESTIYNDLLLIGKA